MKIQPQIKKLNKSRLRKGERIGFLGFLTLTNILNEHKSHRMTVVTFNKEEAKVSLKIYEMTEDKNGNFEESNGLELSTADTKEEAADLISDAEEFFAYQLHNISNEFIPDKTEKPVIIKADIIDQEKNTIESATMITELYKQNNKELTKSTQIIDYLCGHNIRGSIMQTGFPEITEEIKKKQEEKAQPELKTLKKGAEEEALIAKYGKKKMDELAQKMGYKGIYLGNTENKA